MADKNAVFLTRHIGKTTYKVRIYLSETAEETKVAHLLCKDLSRIGRNYLQTGFYTDVKLF